MRQIAAERPDRETGVAGQPSHSTDSRLRTAAQFPSSLNVRRNVEASPDPLRIGAPLTECDDLRVELGIPAEQVERLRAERPHKLIVQPPPDLQPRARGRELIVYDAATCALLRGPCRFKISLYRAERQRSPVQLFSGFWFLASGFWLLVSGG